MSGDGKKFSDLNHLNLRPETKKMRRYIPISISITMFAFFLAWTGMVSSIIFSIVSLDVIFMPLALGLDGTGMVSSIIFSIVSLDVIFMPLALGLDGTGMVSSIIFSIVSLDALGLDGTMYGVGVPSLVLNIATFIYCFLLWGTIKRNDMTGMRNLVKIGCYIMGGLELVVCAAGVIRLGFIIYLVLFTRDPYISPDISGFLTIPIIFFAIFGVFTSLMIHGVRKFKICLVNVNIIFKIVVFALLVIYFIYSFVSAILNSLNYPGMGGIPVLLNINVFLLSSFFFIYYNGYIVLQYNIMLDNMTEERSMDLTHNNIQFYNNVYFNENTVKK